ncbi:hypothetical protein V8C42DRAFT_306530 [Trichoderma barbatum]
MIRLTGDGRLEPFRRAHSEQCQSHLGLVAASNSPACTRSSPFGAQLRNYMWC